MTPSVGILLAIVAAAVVLFSIEWVAADVVALGVLLAVVLTGLLPTEKAFAGFGSDTVMMILGLLILTAMLLRTGVVEIAGRTILRRTGDDPRRLVLVVMVAAASLSAFISNTAATAFFLPVTVGIAARARLSPSRLLLPLAFASILSSSVTLVSTSTNIVVSGLMTRYGLEPMGMFELAPVGLPIAAVGVAYVYLIGRRLIPDREGEGELTERFGIRPYLSELLVRPDSNLVGKTLDEAGLGQELDLIVIHVIRGDRRLVPSSGLKVEAGDVLLVEGGSEEILKVKDRAGIDIKPDVKLSDPDLKDGDLRLVEVILTTVSPLVGRTLKGYRFRERFGLQILAINRHGETLRAKLSEVVLRLGDLLLVQGPRERIAAIEQENTFRVLGELEPERPKFGRARLATAIFGGSLAVAAFEVVPLPVAVLAGALLAFLTRCISPEEAYRAVEWRVIILIGCMLALGSAMEETGTARYLAGRVVDLAGGSDPFWLLTAFFAFTVALTQPMSNQAAAVVVLPIAIETARQVGLDPRAFAMMVAVAASCSYLTPLEPSCVLVYGPGRYRFADFFKVGAPLTVLVYAVAILLVPRVWPLVVK